MAGVVLDSAKVSELINDSIVGQATNGDVSITPDGTGDVVLGTVSIDADQTVGATQDGYPLTYDHSVGACVLTAPRAKVLSSVSGSLTTATHSGGVHVTSGNVTVPNAAGDVGFNCILIAGGAHTVTFNSTTSAAMATGDMMTILVQSTTVIKAVRTAAADLVEFV